MWNSLDAGRVPVRRRRTTMLLAGALMAVAGTVHAQPYPNKPIQIVVGFAAGTTTDIVARITADHLKNKLGQPVIVINKPGANGAIGAQEVARANPDGYTLLVTNTSSMVVNPHLYRKSGYQLTDFAPVSMLTSAPLIVTVGATNERTSSFRTVADLVKFATANPGTLNYAAAGPGNITGLTFRILNNYANIKTSEVQYKSANASQLAVLSGEVDSFIDTPQALPNIKAGKLTALAVTSPQRWAELPNTPTMAEAGFPQIDVIFWATMFAPVKTPPEILERLHNELLSLPDDAALAKQLVTHGVIEVAKPATEVGARVRKESAMWAETIKRENIQLD